MHARMVLGVGKGVLFREVSSVQGLYTYVLIEGFHCVYCIQVTGDVKRYKTGDDDNFSQVYTYIICNHYIIVGHVTVR